MPIETEQAVLAVGRHIEDVAHAFGRLLREVDAGRISSR